MVGAEPVDVSGGIRITGSRGIHGAGRTFRRNFEDFLVMTNERPFFAVLHDGRPAQFPHGATAFVRIVVVEQDPRFLAVCEDDIAVICDQAEEFLAISSDGERIRNVESHDSSVFFRDIQSAHDGVLLALCIPHIAGEMEEVRIFYRLWIDVVPAVELIRSKERVHTSFGIRSNEDYGRTGRLFVRSCKFITEVEVVQLGVVDIPVLVVAYFPRQRRIDAQQSERDDGIRA